MRREDSTISFRAVFTFAYTTPVVERKREGLLPVILFEVLYGSLKRFLYVLRMGEANLDKLFSAFCFAVACDKRESLRFFVYIGVFEYEVEIMSVVLACPVEVVSMYWTPVY